MQLVIKHALEKDEEESSKKRKRAEAKPTPRFLKDLHFKKTESVAVKARQSRKCRRGRMKS